MKRALGIIPARYASTRFPGKLLQDLCGQPVIVRTVNVALQATTLSDVWLATDDARIGAAVSLNCPGVDVVDTSSHCPSGTDRLVEALRSKGMLPLPSPSSSSSSSSSSLSSMHTSPFPPAFTAATFPFDVVVNVQGDEPLLDPKHIDLVVKCLSNNPQADIATLAVPLDPTCVQGQTDISNPNVVKCVVDQDWNAMYFSRAVIPYNSSVSSTSAEGLDTSGKTHYLKHIGLYAYRPHALLKFVATPPSALERTESLEQLRAMEMGMRIKVVQAASAEGGIDTPEQLAAAQKKVGCAPVPTDIRH